ncbi:hypothetical protein J2Z22_002160 [Paenibacillus forsythiae]|uniref:Transposase IS204/IS1001/IS1096/IS1165 zinc-finger domain-containing protein n=1 Tax=Paenibacillus forsythiae TaxID=365616 RepID=A0ABU3H772_9BACL|nr:hypothetical protein [Paenibacillus forsythiae]MDT3426634.1 hypothetical protein [Paenibacillus forsythiae]
MPLQYINEMLGLPELQLHSVLSLSATEVHLEASPVAYKQPCPICCSEQAVKRDGRNKSRKIRHVSVFGKKCFLHFPRCAWPVRGVINIGFVWLYAWVGPKEQYSRHFRTQPVNQALGSTAAHSARMQEAPASTVQRMH